MPELPRRHFLQGAFAVTAIRPFCCVTETLPPESVAFSPAKVVVDLKRAPGLRHVGAAFTVVEDTRKLNIILIHATSGRYVAMDRTCTHGGAQCTYNRKRHTLQCTSLNHAEYDLAGMLLHGRTHGNLRTYETKRTGTIIEIKC